MSTVPGFAFSRHPGLEGGFLRVRTEPCRPREKLRFVPRAVVRALTDAVPAGRHAGCFPWTRHSRLVQFQGRLIRMRVKWHRDVCPDYVLRPSLQRLACSSLCERQMTFGLGSTESFGEKRLFLCCLPSATPLQKGTHCGLTKCGWPRGVVSLAQRDCLSGTCPRPTFWEYRAGRGRAGAEGGLQACFTSAVCWGLVDVDATSGCSPSFALCELHGSSKGCVDLLMNGVSESLPRWRGAWLWAGGETPARLCTHPKKRVVQCSDLRRHSRVIYLFC